MYKFSIAPMTNEQEYIIVGRIADWQEFVTESAKVRELRGLSQKVKKQLNEDDIQRIVLDRTNASELFAFCNMNF